MKKLFIIGLIFLSQIAITSCQKDFLDKAPEEDITIEEAFLQRRYAEAFLTDIYAGVPNEIYFTDMADIQPFIVASDELNVPWPEKFPKLMNRGSWNAINVTGRVWKNMYEGIRKANIFLKYIDLTPLDETFTEVDKRRWIGEARFLRAFYHFMLMRIYGPVPIMDYAADLDDDFPSIKRNTLDQCVTFVVGECDAIMDLLPMHVVDGRQLGRPTAAAALALKARLLLYDASPLWNGNPDYADFTDKDGEHLFSLTNDPERWAIAAAANKACIDQCEAAGYELFYASSRKPIDNYQQLFIVRNNNEVLFARNSGKDGWMERCAFPRSLGGWNGWNPTQKQIDAYEMVNGQMPITGYDANGNPIINPASGYVETGYVPTADPDGRWPAGVRRMYINRDPRFYATINFNGAEFLGRRLEFWRSGADGQASSGRDYNTTGYLLKKFMDPTVNISRGEYSFKTWIFFRLGEFYLNYAEALNESLAAPNNDVYTYVNAIRTRSGMPELPAGLSKEDMRERIRHERRIELAFETHRYFDCHRWKIAHQTDGGSFYGMNIGAGSHLQDDAFYQRTTFETRVFVNPTHYLFPIPQDELDNLPMVVQNPGW